MMMMMMIISHVMMMTIISVLSVPETPIKHCTLYNKTYLISLNDTQATKP